MHNFSNNPEIIEQNPFAAERDYSLSTQVARRGTKSTPKLTYIPSKEVFDYAKQNWGVVEDQYDWNNPEVKLDKLVKLKYQDQFRMMHHNLEHEFQTGSYAHQKVIKERYFDPQTGKIY